MICGSWLHVVWDKHCTLVHWCEVDGVMYGEVGYWGACWEHGTADCYHAIDQCKCMFCSPEGVWEQTPCDVRLAVCAYSLCWVGCNQQLGLLHWWYRSMQLDTYLGQRSQCLMWQKTWWSRGGEKGKKLIGGFTGRGKYSIEADCDWIIRNCAYLVPQSQWRRMLLLCVHDGICVVMHISILNGANANVLELVRYQCTSHWISQWSVVVRARYI